MGLLDDAANAVSNAAGTAADAAGSAASGYVAYTEESEQSWGELAEGDLAAAAAESGEGVVDLTTGGNARQWRDEFYEQEGDLEKQAQDAQEEAERGGVIGNTAAYLSTSRVGLDALVDNPTGPNVQSGTNELITTISPAEDQEDVGESLNTTYEGWRHLVSAPKRAIPDGMPGSEGTTTAALGGFARTVVEEPVLGAQRALTGTNPKTGETGDRASIINVADAMAIGGTTGARAAGKGAARGARAAGLLSRSSDDAAAAGVATSTASTASDATRTTGESTTMPLGLGALDDLGAGAARLSDDASSSVDDADDIARSGADLGRAEVGTTDDVARTSESFSQVDFGDEVGAGATPGPGTSVDEAASGVTTRFGDATEAGAQSVEDAVDAGLASVDEIADPSTVGVSDEFANLADEGATLSDDALVETFGGTNMLDDAADFGSADEFGRTVAGSATEAGARATEEATSLGGRFTEAVAGGFDEFTTALDDALGGTSGADETATATDDTVQSAVESSEMGPAGSLFDTIESGLGIGRYADDGGSQIDDIAEETGQATDDDVAAALGRSVDDSTEETLEETVSTGWRDTRLNPANWRTSRQAAGALGLGTLGATVGMDLFNVGPSDVLGGGASAGNYDAEQVGTLQWNGDDQGWIYEVFEASGDSGMTTLGFAVILPTNISQEDFIDDHNPYPVLDTSGRPATPDPIAGSGSNAVPQGRFGSRGQAEDAWSSYTTWLEENMGTETGDPDAPSLSSSERFTGSLDTPSEVPVGEPFTAAYDINLRSGRDSASGRVVMAIPLNGQWQPLAEISVALNADNTNRNGQFEIPSGWGGVEPGSYEIAMISTAEEGLIDKQSIEFTGGSTGTGSWNEFEVVEQWPQGWNLMRQTHQERDEQRFVVAGKRSGGDTIYLQPDGSASTSPETYATVEDAAAAFDQWAQRAQNGTTDESDTPDPEAGRPSPEGVTEDVQNNSGSMGGIISMARRNPAIASGAAIAGAYALYWAYQNGYLDGILGVVGL